MVEPEPSSLVGEIARTTLTLPHGRVGSRLKWGLRSVQTRPISAGGGLHGGGGIFPGPQRPSKAWPLEMKVEVMISPAHPAWERNICS